MLVTMEDVERYLLLKCFSVCCFSAALLLRFSFEGCCRCHGTLISLCTD